MYGSYSLQTCRPIENIASGDTPRIKGKRNKRKKSKNNTEIVLRRRVQFTIVISIGWLVLVEEMSI